MVKGIATEELDALTDAEFLEELKEAKGELFDLRFSVMTHRLEGSGQLKKVRRDIAHVYTVKHEYELGTRTASAAEK